MKSKSVLVKLREEEKIARRLLILEAAEKEFVEKPFNKVSMRTIAKRAGISPSFIYRYFPDQQTLFVETFMRETNQVFEQMFNMINKSPDGAIEEFIAIYIEYFTKNDQYCRMMMNFFMEREVDSKLFEKLTQIEKKILDHLDIVFRKMKMKGNIREHSHTLFAALSGIVFTFRNHPTKNIQQVLLHRQKIACNLANLFIMH